MSQIQPKPWQGQSTPNTQLFVAILITGLAIEIDSGPMYLNKIHADMMSAAYLAVHGIPRYTWNQIIGFGTIGTYPRSSQHYNTQ